MLPAKDRDWIQKQAIEYRALKRQGQWWHERKGAVAYVAIALGLVVIGSLIRPADDFRSTGMAVTLIACLGFGFYYWQTEKSSRYDDERARRIRETFEERGWRIREDGSIDDGEGIHDPLSTSSYRS